MDLVSIRRVSDLTGLSIHTLRWYEQQGLLPFVQRGSDGRRLYPPAGVRFVRLVQALRRTGMSVADVRSFVQVGAGSAQTHPVRRELLTEHERSIEQKIARLRADREVVRAKIAEYDRLIGLGLDCEDQDPPSGRAGAPASPAAPA